MIPILILILILLPVPAIIGRLVQRTDKSAASLPFRWVSGQILLWSGFQLICVPFILLERQFSDVLNLFNLYTGLLLTVSLVLLFLDHFQKKNLIKPLGRMLASAHSTKASRILWALFWVLLLLQLILAALLAYEEGDDAFYISHSTITVDANTMYQKLPYTGGATGLDARHGLAPFPIWVAYLARMSGLPAATTAQIAVPIVLISMAYALYYLIGKTLLPKQLHLLPGFLVLVELMVLWGGYSLYSAENFLLVRTSQGKAVIANIIIPFLLLLLLILLNKLHKNQKIGFTCWLLLALTMVAGCLCSTLGTILTCLLLGIVGLCTIVCYRKWTLILPLGACCILPICYALLYFVLG